MAPFAEPLWYVDISSLEHMLTGSQHLIAHLPGRNVWWQKNKTTLRIALINM